MTASFADAQLLINLCLVPCNGRLRSVAQEPPSRLKHTPSPSILFHTNSFYARACTVVITAKQYILWLMSMHESNPNLSSIQKRFSIDGRQASKSKARASTNLETLHRDMWYRSNKEAKLTGVLILNLAEAQV